LSPGAQPCRRATGRCVSQPAVSPVPDPALPTTCAPPAGAAGVQDQRGPGVTPPGRPLRAWQRSALARYLAAAPQDSLRDPGLAIRLAERAVSLTNRKDAGALDALLTAVTEARGAGPPIFLKVAPDLEPADIDDIAEIAAIHRLDGLIVSNTTISRPPLASRQAGEGGGLSGEPLRSLAQQRLADFRSATGGAMPLIAAGGIASAEDAYARIRAGASLVQLYSALVYEGPGLARRINRGLVKLLDRDGFATIGQAVGAG